MPGAGTAQGRGTQGEENFQMKTQFFLFIQNSQQTVLGPIFVASALIC